MAQIVDLTTASEMSEKYEARVAKIVAALVEVIEGILQQAEPDTQFSIECPLVGKDGVLLQNQKPSFCVFQDALTTLRMKYANAGWNVNFSDFTKLYEDNRFHVTLELPKQQE